MTFARKIAFVTGASSGIGLSCVRQLLDKGALVAAFDRNAVDPAQSSGQDAPAERLLRFRGDVSKAADIRSAIEQTTQHFGGLDLGFNCAGITGPLAPLEAQDDDAFDSTFAVNMRGIFLATKYEASAMMGREHAAIVNIASIFGYRSMDGFGLYGATKFGVMGLTQSAGIEFAAKGIRVNAVAPGPVKTPFVGDLSEEEEQAASAGIPMGRFAQPDEIARAMLWLASPEASYITGSVLSVDGGYGAQLGRS